MFYIKNMKKILTLMFVIFSNTASGQSLKFEHKFDLGFDWTPISSESIDRIYFDKFNMVVENNIRRYLVLVNSVRFKIETNCEKMESKILRSETNFSPQNNLSTNFYAVKNNLQYVAKNACAD